MENFKNNNSDDNDDKMEVDKKENNDNNNDNDDNDVVVAKVDIKDESNVNNKEQSPLPPQVDEQPVTTQNSTKTQLESTLQEKSLETIPNTTTAIHHESSIEATNNQDSNSLSNEINNNNNNSIDSTNIIRHDKIMESIYNEIVTSVCTDYACNMHRLIKTGKIPFMELKKPQSRKDIYPTIYKKQKEATTTTTNNDDNNDDDNDNCTIDVVVQEELTKYSTDVPTKSLPFINSTRKRSRPCAIIQQQKQQTSLDDDKTDTTSSTIKSQGDTTSSQSDVNNQAAAVVVVDDAATNSNEDIWGRVPLKEPKHPCECQLCGRQVSASRFASHLDKCMGLSTLRSSASTTPRNVASSGGSSFAAAATSSSSSLSSATRFK